MKATLGSAVVSMGLAAALVAFVTVGLGAVRKQRSVVVLGGRFVPAILVSAVLAVLLMEWALVSHDFSLRYVAENGSRATPLLYTVAGLWASLEGSILLWALVLAVHVGLLWWRHRDDPDPVGTWALVAALGVAVFFFGLMAGPASPFEAVAGAAPSDGRGPNPLLQNHPLMAVHPPMLYLGYVGFTVPFAYAIGALVTGRADDRWLKLSRRTTLVAWAFLTAGIVLGAWWSYEVLGWGGYFAWDPVENASLMPWLTATAFLHSLMAQERRRILRVWNISLLVATFCLTILGTFLTRSGVVASVHAFSESAIGPALLGFLAVSAGVGIVLIGWRAPSFGSSSGVLSPLSRDGAFVANNILFAALAGVVLIGTTFPLVAEAVNGQQLSVGEPYFVSMAAPLGIALLFLMAAAPALPWRGTTWSVVQRRLGRPAWFAAIVMAALAAGGARGVAQLAAFGLAAFVVAATVAQIATATAARRRSRMSGWGRALAGTFLADRRRYGGLVVHVGVAIIAVALAASKGYATHHEVTLARGESAVVDDYTVTYAGVRTTEAPNKTVVAADVEVRRGDDAIGTLSPSLAIFPGATSAIGTPSVRSTVREDLYLTLISSPNDAGEVTLGVFVNPLVMWLWIGGGVIVLGAAFAATPTSKRAAGRRTAVVAASEPVEVLS